MDWIRHAQEREMWQVLVNVVMNLQDSWNSGNYLTSWRVTTFSTRTLFHGDFDYNLLWEGFISSGCKRFDQSDTQNKTSVKSVPWETAENSSGIEKRRRLLFQSLSRSHFFTTSVPHSLVQPRTHSSVHSQTHSVTRSLNSRPRNTFTRFLHSFSSLSNTFSHSLTHSVTPSSRNTFTVTSSFSHSLAPFDQPPYSFIHSIVTHFAASSTSSSSICIITFPHSIPSFIDYFRNDAVFPSVTYIVTPYFIKATAYLCSVTPYHL